MIFPVMTQGGTVYRVNAFTQDAGSGNPAAVCMMRKMETDAWMQGLAKEMNVSETAFLLPIQDGFSLRWFTPTMEVNLCGHATLASAHVIWNELTLTREVLLNFQTKSGILKARNKLQDGIELDFPALPFQIIHEPMGLREVLGFAPVSTARSEHRLLVECGTATQIRNFKPDFGKIATLEYRGVLLTARSDNKNYDIVSRYFAPKGGIPEDPVTGSAHCVLGPYWEKRLGKSEILAYQASPRGGEMKVETTKGRVFLTGHAMTVSR